MSTHSSSSRFELWYAFVIRITNKSIIHFVWFCNRIFGSVQHYIWMLVISWQVWFVFVTIIFAIFSQFYYIFLHKFYTILYVFWYVIIVAKNIETCTAAHCVCVWENTRKIYHYRLLNLIMWYCHPFATFCILSSTIIAFGTQPLGEHNLTGFVHCHLVSFGRRFHIHNIFIIRISSAFDHRHTICLTLCV